MTTKDVQCECGEATGEQCAWKGSEDETTQVEWMPEHLRGSHERAGNSGVWPHNGAVRLRVHVNCAEMLEGDCGIDPPSG